MKVSYKLKIEQDEDNQRPDNDFYENRWVWYIKHRNFRNKNSDKLYDQLYDDFNLDNPNTSLIEDLKDIENQGYLVQKIQYYQHSGINIWIGERSRDWDSGSFALAICKKDYDGCTQEELEGQLYNEVEEWNLRQAGECYFVKFSKVTTCKYQNLENPEDIKEFDEEEVLEEIGGFLTDDSENLQTWFKAYIEDCYHEEVEKLWDNAWEKRYD